jgi:hypothetical protein
MALNPSNRVAANIRGTDGTDGFPNLAGHPDPDAIVIEELNAAGIRHYSFEYMRRMQMEVKTAVGGTLDPSGWLFDRRWSYWAAKGPGIPPEDARNLHEEFGKEVRVQGHCGCPGPECCRGFAVGLYHVDTPRGLKALADTIKAILARSETKEAPK